jgi:hypothetical protein
VGKSQGGVEVGQVGGVQVKGSRLPSGDGVLMRCICGRTMSRYYDNTERQLWRCVKDLTKPPSETGCNNIRSLPLCRHCYAPMQAIGRDSWSGKEEMRCLRCGSVYQMKGATKGPYFREVQE